MPDGPRGSGPVTIGDLMRSGRLMWTYCTACGHERDLDPATLPLPPDTPVPGLGCRHMRCTACGSRKVDTKPELCPGGVVASRKR
ncbi:MAG: hypothetical protein ABL907_09475 [Hyphomicrobium sp.]